MNASGETRACCDLHRERGCCGPADCGPCCDRCPTCPTLNRQCPVCRVPNQDHRTAEEWAGTRCDDPWHEARKEQVIEANRLFHMVLRQAQAAYSAGLRDGPEACMEWLGNALRGPGQLPPEGSDPQWYSEDAWTSGPPWQAIPRPNATVSEPWQAPKVARSPK